MDNQKKKYFKLTNLSLANSTSVFILLFMILFLGLSSYMQMPKELFPEIKIPTIYVSTPYPGNSPEDIENLVTRHIEQEVQSIKGIKNLKSTSIQDYSAVIVEFNTDVDVNEVLQEVKDAVDKAKKDLPTDLPADPSVQEIDFSEMPILNINLSGDFSIDNLKDYAELLKDKIEILPQINKVELKGTLEKEVKISVDLFKMEQSEISFRDIEGAVANENLSMAGGEVIMDGARRSIRIKGEFDRAEDMKDIIVKHEKGNIVYLRDIATVEDGYKDANSYARMDGFPVVSLDVVKKSGENLLEATDQINEILAEAKAKTLPKNLTVTITNDQSEQTRAQVKNLENSIISGVILVVVVLLFFLGLRNALFVGLAIPMSMFLSFLVLGAMGVTINMVVLFGLILALGMLVDNGIVVVENIYRLYEEEGLSVLEACKQGVGEVAVPIIASTATTLAAFFPLLFWNDLMGEFMKYIPMTLIIVLTSSLVVALVINPVVAKTFLKPQEDVQINKKKVMMMVLASVIVAVLAYIAGSQTLGNIAVIVAGLTLLNVYVLRPGAKVFQDKTLVSLENGYLKVLKSVLKGKRPVWYMVGMIGLLFFSFMIFGISQPKVSFFPSNEPKYVNIFVESPVGSDILYTDSLTRIIEQRLDVILKDDKEVVQSIVSNVGAGTSDPGEGPSMGDTPNKARIQISFVEFELRNGASTSDVLAKISKELGKLPGVKISAEKNREGPPAGKPINLEISGEDIPTLLAIAEQVELRVAESGIEGIEGLKMDMELGKPELTLSIDRSKARRLGVSTMQIAGTIRTALFGKEISKFKDGEDDYPVQLRLDKSYRNNISSLMNQKITFRDASTGKIAQVPISAVATYTYTSSYGSIKRKDLDRVVTLFSNVIEGYNANEINIQLKELMKDFTMPESYTYKFTGEQEEQAKTMSFLITALIMAVALIALILVTQFNSVIKPLIIIASVVFSTIGVFLGLTVFNMEFVVIMTGIGIVSLAGIVVNNAIVLIDYIELIKLRKKNELGLSEDDLLPGAEITNAIIEGGKTRLRPVLLTAITTILGLLPMATGMNIDFAGLVSSFNPDIYFGGDNAAFWGPMAWTVIFGLTFATFLTLVMVPVMYIITEKIRIRNHNRKQAKLKAAKA